MDGIEHSFLFADLVGFTGLTERCGDELAADVALEFVAGARCLAAEHGCEVVKSLGDAVMVHGHEPGPVVALGLALARGAGHGPLALRVRVGVHTGTAVQRGDDWYGAAVNVASRLVDAAAPGEVLLSEATRRRLAVGSAALMVDRGARSFKNVAAPVAVFAAAAC